MYGINLKTDAIRIIRAILTNQLARWAPRFYLRLTKQTGRGGGEISSRETANYFQDCFRDYFKMLKINPNDVTSYLSSKSILEYGPGDLPGVALLMVAHGAEQVTCVDRFPMVSLSSRNVEVIELLMSDMSGEVLRRAKSCFVEEGNPASGFSSKIQYVVNSYGLSGLHQEVDLVISRAVLEHVNNLSASFADMYRALKIGGTAVHEVDLKSHGLHRKNPLDFLVWPKLLWSWMYSYKGVPNRLRINHYREALARTNFSVILMQPDLLAEEQDIQSVRPYLAKPFRSISDEDLSWLSFWMVLHKVSDTEVV